MLVLPVNISLPTTEAKRDKAEWSDGGGVDEKTGLKMGKEMQGGGLKRQEYWEDLGRGRDGSKKVARREGCWKGRQGGRW